MLNQPMMEKLLAMRLRGMVEGLKTQEQDRAINELSFLERLSLLVDQQWTWRENQALAPGPSGSQRPPHRNARRVHAQETQSATGREEGMNQRDIIGICRQAVNELECSRLRARLWATDFASGT